ncbi:MAG: PilZ domain-containing protein [Candidatus Omnitrophota bacterium]|nr:MAG: PilZ domain-containing protein [Candidatus Omnitrophota bacterium]
MAEEQYLGPERRRFPRLNENYVVSYRKTEAARKEYDLSQTKNISRGGACIATRTQFEKGAHLEIVMRVPFRPEKITVEGEVVESKEVVKNLVSHTRIKFVNVDPALEKELGAFLEQLLEEEGEEEEE